MATILDIPQGFEGNTSLGSGECQQLRQDLRHYASPRLDYRDYSFIPQIIIWG